MAFTANFWIEKLQLRRHVEGGSFKETYRSDIVLPQNQLPGTFKGNRNLSTSIYFLLEKGQFSAFHRIASDEQWHFYDGGTLWVFEIRPNGELMQYKLGKDPETADHNFQCVVRAGSWFASVPADGVDYSLAGCTVSPGFDFADFELAKREDLIQQFPQHKSLIASLTYDQ